MSLKAPKFRPVWIASYPRSGNTFLRIIFESVFSLTTYSIYNLEGSNIKDPSADALEKSDSLPHDWRNRISTEAEAPQILVKTHNPPEDDSPAIYVVRDGRASIHSYFKYHQDFAFEQPGLTQIILGACQFGSWSWHYRSWKPKERPRTLVLRFEDLVARPVEQLETIGRFIGVSPQSKQIPSFESLQKKYPAFFRKGQSFDFLESWNPGQRAIFNCLHGPVMHELGYPYEGESFIGNPEIREISEISQHVHELYRKTLNTNAWYRNELEARDNTLKQLQNELAKLRKKSIWNIFGSR